MTVLVPCLYRRSHLFAFGRDPDDEQWYDLGYVCGRHARRWRGITEPGGIWHARFGGERLKELRGRLLRPSKP